MKKTKWMNTTFDIPHLAIPPPKEFDEEKILKWSMPFINGKDKVFIDYPFQKEAFPVMLITSKFTYDIFHAVVQGEWKPIREKTKTHEWLNVREIVWKQNQKRNMVLAGDDDNEPGSVIVAC